MRIHHFSTYRNGGAAIAAQRIAAGIDQLPGFSSQFFYRQDPVQQPNNGANAVSSSELAGEEAGVELEPDGSGFWYRKFTAKRRLREFQQADAMFQKFLAQRPPEQPTFSPARGFWANRISQSAKQADILHLHWVAFLFDYPTFFRSLGNRPVVWTLHDMNPLTGGCHYSGSCSRYQQGCGRCPLLESADPADISAFSWQQKQHSLRKAALDIVAPSRWLLDAAQSSGVFPRHTRWHHINYGMDAHAHQPLEKARAKQLLGLNPQTPVILFAADNLDDPRKGALELENALSRIPSILSFQLLTFGKGSAAPLAGRREPKNLGFLETNAQKNVAYSAADIFVLPSLQDNQPQTGLEAMACETPVVAFRAGGIPEFVVDGCQGLLAEPGAAEQLSDRISQLLENESLRHRLGKAARRKVINDFDLSSQSRRYAEVYELASNAGRSGFWKQAS